MVLATDGSNRRQQRKRSEDRDGQGKEQSSDSNPQQQRTAATTENAGLEESSPEVERISNSSGLSGEDGSD
ncbi:OLC1v1019376C1 [Oldenlandia corymbosa var. corymbosa]|uniref:OLC1v1019376C1 n=1 Tax=Oldenlandia corymbosa var. corymbosa TaxID=529605 RepID=A0AAV1EDW7_OLDCO|nr:OLC1v1019376C1 [Oldenlandia corymbosa var. corymbosa]